MIKNSNSLFIGEMKIKFILVVTLLLTFCVRKSMDNKHPVSKETIRGMVINNCTDSGLAGAEVLLKISDKDGLVFQTKTLSDNNGEFAFPDIEIDHSNDYTNSVQIPNSTQPELNGTTMYFEAEQSAVYMNARVSPKFAFLNTMCQNNFIDPNDSIKIKYHQKVFARNVPGMPNTFFSGEHGSVETSIKGMNSFPMGLYNITIYKWRGGSYSVTFDSIYMGWGDTKTYTVNW